MNSRLLVFLPALFVLSSYAFSGAPQKKDIRQKAIEVQNIYLSEAFTLTKNAVGFSAPVSARAYAYLGVGIYESSKLITHPANDLTLKLNQYSKIEPTANEVNALIVANEVNFQLCSYLYRSMPPSNQKHLMLIHDSIQKANSKKAGKDVIAASIAYGKTISEHIIAYSKTDGADDAYLRNYPENYHEPECISCWTKTTPGFFSALLPYWGENRYFLEENKTIFDSINGPDFGLEKESRIYTDSYEIFKLTNDQNPEYELIAEYWDDSPGYSGTPSGHFFTMAKTIANNQNLDLEKRSELFLALGISLNDNFITCWKAKFHFNFIRPITYIQRYINPIFNTFIASPSFPEYPSGHSMQSGGGTEVLKAFFGNELTFTDSTNNERTDIIGKPRTYNSFDQLAQEISVSRIYGGIHFRTTCNNSLIYGGMTGNNTVKVLGLKP